MKIEIHRIKDIATILDRMKNRIKVFRFQLPDGYHNAEVLDIEEIKSIFNEEFKSGVKK